MTPTNTYGTEKIYDREPLAFEFTATVLSCVASGEGFDTVLDRTAFFPTGGGQSCDTGSIETDTETVSVTDVCIKDGIIVHKTTGKLTEGERIRGCIEKAPRLEKMASHGGEHIISAVIHRRFGFNNVGFHMGKLDTTADFDGVMSDDVLSEIEAEANDIVRRCLPITIDYPSAEELRSIVYRSKLDLTSDVRLVKIGNIDVCACCAPHFPSTGMIGLIKIISSESLRGGTRIHMLCGDAALKYVSQTMKTVSDLTKLLSAKTENIGASVLRLVDEEKRLNEEISHLNDKLNSLICEGLSEVGTVCLFDERDDAVALRNLAISAAKKTNGAVGVFGVSKLVICNNNGGIKEPFALFAKETSCRGGGSDTLVCGSFSCGRDVISASWKAFFGGN